MSNTHKVCIDIGHGVNTYPPSKGYKGFAEFTFNNAVGKMAKDLARINGFKVVITQPFDGRDVILNERTAKANMEGCDMGISIHANASSNNSVTGHEFWYWHTKETSKKLATLADANAIALLPNKRRGLKVSKPLAGINFAMVRDTKMPFVLAEFGFFTNDHERVNLLQSSDFQMKCAKVIVKTFCDYVGKEFKLMTTSRPPEPLKVPLWKSEPLQRLYKEGVINDYEGWLYKIDEPAPNWLVFILIDKLNQMK